MDWLDPETEKLLKEILDNDKDFPAILRLKLENCNWEESQKLRSQIKLLREYGYISKLTWGDNVPLLGRIEQKGRTYFIMKEKQQEMSKETIQKDRIFISHSSKDENFVVKLAQLFELLGVSRNNIFCSSIEGQGVKHGKKIEESVRNEIIENKVLIYIISKNFLDSNYCLNELGAGWILSDQRTQNKNLFHIKLPDVSFDEIKGFIGGGDKCTECNEQSITTFVEELEEILKLPPKKPTAYRNLVDNFIKDTKAFLDEAEQTSKLSKDEQKKQQLEKMKNMLSKLTTAERKIIKDIFNSQSGEVELDPTSAIVAGMQYKKIIFTGVGYYDALDPRSSFALQPWVYEVLENDADLKKRILA